ncbi:MAG: hypothetical protein ACREDU_10390, partial [Methylocella sp.]
ISSGWAVATLATTGMSNKPYRSHEEATIESFQKDPHFAAEYLNAIFVRGTSNESSSRSTVESVEVLQE